MPEHGISFLCFLVGGGIKLPGDLNQLANCAIPHLTTTTTTRNKGKGKTVCQSGIVIDTLFYLDLVYQFQGCRVKDVFGLRGSIIFHPFILILLQVQVQVI